MQTFASTPLFLWNFVKFAIDFFLRKPRFLRGKSDLPNFRKSPPKPMQTVLQQKSQNFVNLAQKFSGNFLLKKNMNFSLIFHTIFVFAHFFKNSRHIRLNLANSGTVWVVILHLFPFSAFSSYFIKRRFLRRIFACFHLRPAQKSTWQSNLNHFGSSRKYRSTRKQDRTRRVVEFPHR